MKVKRIVFKEGELKEEDVDWEEVEMIKEKELSAEQVILKRINEIVSELENIKKMLRDEEERVNNIDVVDEKTKSLNELLNKLKEKGYEVNGIYE